LWDLSKCKQRSEEPLHDYTRCFSKQRTELLHILDHDVILAFISGATYKDLVWELGCNCPKNVNKLMDVVANYAAGEEAVGAFFSGGKDRGKAQENYVESPRKGLKKNNKKKKAWQGKREVVDDDFVATVECKSPRGPLRGPSSTRC
jgi:hypothetical protein